MSTTPVPGAPPAPVRAPDPLMKYGHDSWWPFGILLGLWLAAVLGLVIWGVQERSGMQPYADRTGVTQCAAPAPAADKKPATLTAQGQANTAIVFGRYLQPQTRTLQYVLDDPSSVLAGADCVGVQVGQFLRDSGDTELNPAKITATGVLQGNLLRVDVKFDRTADSLGLSGSYAGAISVVDPRVQRVDVPMTVTMAYPTWQFPLALLIGILLPAVIYLWLLKGSFQGTINSNTNATHATGYLLSRNGLLAVAAGGAAAFGSFTALYLTSATWDADPLRYIALMTGMFGAFIAAAAGVSAAGVDKSGT
ncbi:hypothetical protein AB0J83_36495 [Actinoplanes sp. NPDC049596]|uniref:hypothetical protein n=1 Tax=unclassified Actinoplanes TaxID=2626549 RepID=UPI00341D8A3E